MSYWQRKLIQKFRNIGLKNAYDVKFILVALTKKTFRNCTFVGYPILRIWKLNLTQNFGSELFLIRAYLVRIIFQLLFLDNPLQY